MPKNRDLQTLLDIEQAARNIVQFKSSLSREVFLEDKKTQAAIILQLLIIGEATKRLSMTLRQQHPEIPWSFMAGMRDNMIHEYEDIDIQEVWKTSENDIPTLLSSLQVVRTGVEQLRLTLEDES